MRHRKLTIKLGRTPAHRDALLSSLVNNLILAGRIRTTVPKAKAARRVAERMVTLGKRGTLAARRRAASRLRNPGTVKRLFESVAPEFKDRQGGYTRIVRVGRRGSDSSEIAILEWVNYIPQAPRKKKSEKGKAEPAAAPQAEAPKKKTARRSSRGKKKEEAAK